MSDRELYERILATIKEARKHSGALRRGEACISEDVNTIEWEVERRLRELAVRELFHYRPLFAGELP